MTAAELSNASHEMQPGAVNRLPKRKVLSLSMTRIMVIDIVHTNLRELGNFCHPSLWFQKDSFGIE